MFEGFYGMSRPPFSKDIPAEAMYESAPMTDTLGRLKYTVSESGFAVLTADPGCGKTTTIRKLDCELPRDGNVLLYISDSKLTPRLLYKGLLDQLGVEARPNRGEAKRQLQKEVEIIRHIHKKQVVCVLDEAHLLEKETIEEFRFLLNCDFDSQNPMALILVGQGELWDEKLRLKRYAAVRQRIDTACCPIWTVRKRRPTSAPTWSIPAAPRRFSRAPLWTRSTRHRPESCARSTRCAKRR